MTGSEQVELPDGTRLWTTTAGDGPPVVCCHGGPGLWDYLGSLAALLQDRFRVIRFDQRGCARSSGSGPFTIAQAVDDLDKLRAALGYERWNVLGHSWGAELALRYAATYPRHTEALAYIAGVGAGDGFHDAYVAERDRRLGGDRVRWDELRSRERNAHEEREWCLLQWRPDFSPAGAEHHALELWRTRPPGTTVNVDANRELWADRDTEDLLTLAASVDCPVTMIFGADDPRPWSAADPLFAALPRARRLVLDDAGHAPWVEQPAAVRTALLDLFRRQ